MLATKTTKEKKGETKSTKVKKAGTKPKRAKAKQYALIAEKLALDVKDEDERPLADRCLNGSKETPEELETTVLVKAATNVKRPRAKPTKRAKPAKQMKQRTEEEEPHEEKPLLKKENETVNKEELELIKPATKKLKGWKGWAIVEEDVEEEGNADDVNEEEAEDVSSCGQGTKLRCTKRKRGFN
ncbi:hypothetical protein DFH28DRAFT_936485 [Melampsora americana]|nr:hypothetical protein DFH28DRAFT_936485 [Melampsora americana]